jgi:hypothetical protein
LRRRELVAVMLSPDEASKLQNAVNEALILARWLPKDERERMGAINWGDLSCRDVEERRSLLHEGNSYVAVLIEEAHPDAVGLHKFVADRLAQLGWRDVHVETEW